MSFIRRIFNKDQQSIAEYREGREALSRMRQKQQKSSGATRDETPADNDEGADSPPTSAEQEADPETPAESLTPYLEDATTVAVDTTFQGNLATRRNLYIEGFCDGELVADAAIVIAEGAHVKATIRATDVIVAGILEGTVEARNRFHVMPSGSVSATVDSAVLVVEHGSDINCRFVTHSGKEKRSNEYR